MTADRSLSPSDAVVAARSFPRRFQDVFARTDDEQHDADEVARRAGSDGSSALDHLAAATTVLQDLDRAIATGRARDVDAGTVPASGGAVDEYLQRFASVATAAADRIDAVPSDGWGTLLPMTQDAVAVVADHLRAAQRVLREVSS